MNKLQEINRLLTQATNALSNGERREAHETCLEILKLDAKHPEAHYLLGVNALERREVTKARTLLTLAINTDPNQMRYYLQLARTYILLHANKDASQTLQKALSLTKASAHDYDTIGVLFTKLGDHKQALHHFLLASQNQPKNISNLYNLATSQRINGALPESLTSLERIVTLEPNFYKAYGLIAELRKATTENNLVNTIQALLDQPNLDPVAHLHLCHALAREYESLGNINEASQWLTLGNKQRKQEIGYQAEEDQKLFDHLINACSPDFVQQKTSGYKPRNNQPKPIFIIGMPRSGTTLMERIITNHSQVAALGELLDLPLVIKQLSKTPSNLVFDAGTVTAAADLDFYHVGQQYCQRLETYKSSSNFIVDKLPLNFFYAAYIHKALPEARIICLRRNPLDICLSNFKQLFAINFSYYNYSLDIEDCAHYLVAFNRLINHWQDVLPADRFLEIQYEDLIDNTEALARNALEFIGLDWQENCLSFEQNQAPVATASAVQVRNPIYRSSVGAWQKYAELLTPAKTIFSNAGIAID